MSEMYGSRFPKIGIKVLGKRYKFKDCQLILHDADEIAELDRQIRETSVGARIFKLNRAEAEERVKAHQEANKPSPHAVQGSFSSASNHKHAVAALLQRDESLAEQGVTVEKLTKELEGEVPTVTEDASQHREQVPPQDGSALPQELRHPSLVEKPVVKTEENTPAPPKTMPANPFAAK